MHAITRRPFHREVDDFFNSFYNRPLSPAKARWTPAVDVRETETDFVFAMDLPGMSKEDVRIEFQDGVLSLRGEKKTETLAEGEAWRRVERSYGSFDRRFELPTHVKGDAIKARFADGVLMVTVPKADEIRPREISID